MLAAAIIGFALLASSAVLVMSGHDSIGNLLFLIGALILFIWSPEVDER